MDRSGPQSLESVQCILHVESGARKLIFQILTNDGSRKKGVLKKKSRRGFWVFVTYFQEHQEYIMFLSPNSLFVLFREVG